MASGPITSWQIDGEQWEKWQTLFGGGGLQITADADCSHEIKRRLLLGSQSMLSLLVLKPAALLSIFVCRIVWPELWITQGGLGWVVATGC